MKKLLIIALALIMMGNSAYTMDSAENEMLPIEIEEVNERLSYLNPNGYTLAGCCALAVLCGTQLATEHTMATAVCALGTLATALDFRNKKVVYETYEGVAEPKRVCYYGNMDEADKYIATMRKKIRERNAQRKKVQQMHDDNDDQSGVSASEIDKKDQ